MRRIALSAVVGAVGLMAVSIGVCQTAPRPLPPPNVPAPPLSVLPFPPPPLVGEPALPPPPARVYVTTATPVTGAAPAEKMVVKVYAVPDLVADIQRRPPAGVLTPFGAPSELALAMQQVQLQVQMAQQAAGQPVAERADAPDEATKKLERLKKALRVAAPKKSWVEEGGEGEIEVYPEALCLIVRQTAACHEAIGDLLTQLRATQSIQIELTVELMSFAEVKGDASAGVIKMLNRELSAEDLAQFRNYGGKTAVSSVVRMANGRTATAGMTSELPLQFTALTAGDHSQVQFRTDLAIPIEADDAADMAAMTQALSQVRTVTAGKSLAFMVGEGESVLLVTPKVIDLAAAAAK